MYARVLFLSILIIFQLVCFGSTTVIVEPSGENGVVGTCPENSGVWSPWDDRDDPTGLADHEGREYYKYKDQCDKPLAIQARVVGSNVSFTSTEDVLTIGPEIGLVCWNANQTGGMCADYEVRYCCPANTTTAQISTTAPDTAIIIDPVPTTLSTTTPFPINADGACFLLDPCINEGLCLDNEIDEDGYTCLCLAEFEGKNCEEPVIPSPPPPINITDEVDTVCSISPPCDNGGLCVDTEYNEGSSYMCICQDGWKGTHCEVIDAPALEPTQPVTTDVPAPVTDDGKLPSADTADDVWCYVCNSSINTECDMSTVHERYKKACRKGQKYCITFIQTLIDEQTIERDCSDGEINHEECSMINELSNNCMSIKTCQGDGCNGVKDVLTTTTPTAEDVDGGGGGTNHQTNTLLLVLSSLLLLKIFI